MHPVIHFRSARFDPSAEARNPINPVAGASLLEWLRAQPGMETLGPPAPEDWGWHADARHDGRAYMIGARIRPDPGGQHECILQIVRRRTWRERIAGIGRLDSDDPVLSHVLALVRAEPAFTDVVLDVD